MYVYQITNLINGKMYIGITNNYKKRWENEKSNPKDPKRQQVITKAIAKYGVENFKFEVLFSHLTIEDAIIKEQTLIKEKNTQVPNGYNVDPGGKYHPSFSPKFGAENGRACLTEEEAQYIKDNRDKPMYILYEEFADKINYESFKKCYNHKTYTNLIPKVAPYPYNIQYSLQFVNGKLEYDEIVDIRTRYAKGEYWKIVYEDYKDKYTENSFWRLYTGLSYKLVMPEVFTPENRKIHASLKRSGSNNSHAVLRPEDVKKIRKLHEEGATNKELYALYPFVSTVTIRDIINFKTWKNIL